MIIYKVTNLVNQKIYIGQSINTLEYRKSGHYRDARCIKKKNVYFHNALLKYKPEDFKWEIIDTAETIEELNKKEIYWVSYYKSNNKDKGYNLKAGGDSGGKCCESTKQKIGETTKIKWTNPETAKRMLEGLRKGTETVKHKALVNFKTTKCKQCNIEFTYRPCDVNQTVPKFCSNSCYNIYMKKVSKNNLKIATQFNIINKNKERQIIKQKLLDWLPNFYKFQNIPMNKLTPLFEELMPLCGYKDPRTLILVLGFTSKKEFFKKLSKMYAELIGNYKN